MKYWPRCCLKTMSRLWRKTVPGRLARLSAGGLRSIRPEVRNRRGSLAFRRRKGWFGRRKLRIFADRRLRRSPVERKLLGRFVSISARSRTRTSPCPRAGQAGPDFGSEFSFAGETEGTTVRRPTRGPCECESQSSGRRAFVAANTAGNDGSTQTG